MIKKISFLLFLFFFAAISLHGQGVRAEFQLGYGNFQMQRLNQFVGVHAGQFNFPVKVVENFPSYYCFRFNLAKVWEDEWFTGISIGKSSSGARAHYQDYSGELRFDHLVSCINVSLFAGKDVYTYRNLSLGASLGVGILFSDYDIKTYAKIYNQRQENTEELVSASLASEPAVRINYKVRKLNFGLSAGLLGNAGGRIHRPGERDAYLVDSNKTAISLDWSGYRTFMVVGYRF